MSSKPVFPGSYGEYEKLPSVAKKYYAPPTSIVASQQQSAPHKQPTPWVIEENGVTKTVSPPNVQESPEQLRAIVFYSKIGRPELAGSYTAPEIPAGYEAVEAKEVYPKGVEGELTPPPYVEVTVREKAKPLSLGQIIASTSPFAIGTSIAETIMGKKATEQQVATIRTIESHLPSGVPSVKGTPTELLGGMVVAFEAPVYTVGSILGVKGLPEPPTVTGAIVGSGIQSAVSGKLVVSEEWLSLEKGSPAYAMGTVMGDIGLSYLTGKAVSKAWTKIRGVKVTKIVGATEKATYAQTETFQIGERTTQLALKTERAPSSFAKYLKKMERFFQPKTIDVAGTQVTLTKTVAPELTTDIFSASFQDIGRKATPYISAAKTAVKPQNILKTIGAKIGLVKSKPVIVSEFGIVKTATPALVRKAVYSQRIITSVQIFGEIDKQVFLDLAKNVPPKIAQSFYSQMGGLAPQLLEKVPSKTIPLFTKVVGYSVSRGTGAFALGASVPTLTKIRKTKTAPSIIAKQTPKPIIAPTISRIDETTEPLDIGVYPTQTPRVYPTPIIKLPQGPKPTEILEVPQIQKPTPDIPIPTIPAPIKPKIPLLFFPRGGGLVGGGRGKRIWGKWYPRKHKVKTWEQQLETFGVVGGKRKIPKVFSELGKSESFGDIGRVAKPFKLGTVKKKRRRRKHKKR